MKIVVAGNYGANNLGDELILEGLLKTLRTVKPAVEITVMCASPNKIKEKFEINSCHKFPAGLRSLIAYSLNGNFKKTRKAVKECDFFILGGGGLFDDTSLKAVWIWSVQALFAYLYKRPVVMYGQNLKPIKSKFCQRMVKKLFKKASFIAVRDEDSKKVLKTLIKGKKIYLMPDLIFKVDPKFEQAKENKLLVCLRPTPETSQDFVDNIAKTLNSLLGEDENLKVEFIPFQEGMDEKFHASIIEKITEKDRIHIHPFNEKRHKVERLFSEAKLVLGMRLHSILMAINTGTPFVAINYNPKVENILETLNLHKFLVDPKGTTPSNLKSLIDKAQNDRERIGERLKVIKNTQAQKHLEVEGHLKKLLD
jgi:polysaccharide pyruvyl transferase CsaB